MLFVLVLYFFTKSFTILRYLYKTIIVIKKNSYKLENSLLIF